MGSSKSGGYVKQDAITPELKTLLDQYMQTSQQTSATGAANTGQAAQGFMQFLPGGGGGDAIKAAAQKNFEQTTIPSILNAVGGGSKGSSALNQALASGASNLNTDLASQLAQMQLQAASGLGNIGLSQGGLGVNQGQLASKDQFAYAQKQMPFWQQALLGTIQAGGQAAKAFF